MFTPPYDYDIRNYRELFLKKNKNNSPLSNWLHNTKNNNTSHLTDIIKKENSETRAQELKQHKFIQLQKQLPSKPETVIQYRNSPNNYYCDSVAVNNTCSNIAYIAEEKNSDSIYIQPITYSDGRLVADQKKPKVIQKNIKEAYTIHWLTRRQFVYSCDTVDQEYAIISMEGDQQKYGYVTQGQIRQIQKIDESSLLFAGTNENNSHTVNILDTRTDSISQDLQISHQVTRIAQSVNEKLFAVSTNENAVIVFDLRKSDAPLQLIQDVSSKAAAQVAWLPHSTTHLMSCTGSDGKKINLLDIHDHTPTKSWDIGTPLSRISITNDHKVITTNSISQLDTIYFHHLDRNHKLQQLGAIQGNSQKTGRILTNQLSNDKNYLITGHIINDGHDTQTIKIWDLAKHKNSSPKINLDNILIR